jgi:hypothetical protein|tara:strand:+ start:874 stop:1101 length:228 start_codon:yes stop_codon:yes gene_type:complete
MAVEISESLPWAELEVKGLVPPNIRRCIIDMEVGNAVKVYFECFGDSEMLELIVPEAIEQAVKVGTAKRCGDTDA